MLKRDLAELKIKEMNEYYQKELGNNFIFPENIKVEQFLLVVEHYFKASVNHETTVRFLTQAYHLQVTEEEINKVMLKTTEFINYFLKLIS